MQLHSGDEQLILASMLIVRDAIPRVLALGIRSTSYGSTKNQVLHDAIVDCYINKQSPIDSVDVICRLIRHEKLEIAGGAEYFASLLGRAATREQFPRLLERYSE